MSLAQQLSRLGELFGAGLPLSNRNHIIDGNKDQWTSTAALALAATTAYTSSTMYRGQCGTAGAATYGQQLFELGTPGTLGMSRPVKYYGQFVQTAASTGSLAALTGPQISQRLESVTRAENGFQTVSVWLWSAAPVTVTQAFVTQNFGTGGSPSAAVTTLTPVVWNLTTIPQRFSVKLAVPSIAGMTLGTGGNDFVEVGVCYPVGATFTINDAQWQVEWCSPGAGPQGLPTTFEYRGIPEELQRVLRHYEVLTGGSYGSGVVGAVATAYITIDYQPKRTASPAFGGSALATFYFFTPATSSAHPVGLSVFNIGVSSGMLAVTYSGMTPGQGCMMFDAGGSFMTLDARL